ncbi:hypothetical protein [Solidesulfovibrio sp.]
MAELTPQAVEMRKRLLAELPPVIARKHVGTFLGGLVSAESMANYDARREGPKNALSVGDSVAYYREELVEWLLTRWKVTIRKTREERLLELATRDAKPGKRSRGFSRA